MGAGQPGEADWEHESRPGWEEHWTVVGWVQPQRSGDQLRHLRFSKTRLVLRVQLGGSLSHLALECLDILPGKLQEVVNRPNHPSDTAEPSTWT